MSTKIPGQVEPSAANPPDKKAVIDGKLHDRVQGLLPLVQHYVQLLSLSYRPANPLLFPPLTISVPTSETRPEGIHVCIQVCPDYQKPCATLTRQRRVSPDSKNVEISKTSWKCVPPGQSQLWSLCPTQTQIRSLPCSDRLFRGTTFLERGDISYGLTWVNHRWQGGRHCRQLSAEGTVMGKKWNKHWNQQGCFRSPVFPFPTLEDQEVLPWPHELDWRTPEVNID